LQYFCLFILVVATPIITCFFASDTQLPPA
jgi:hypothetical protein